jgi:hypothetical protein
VQCLENSKTWSSCLKKSWIYQLEGKCLVKGIQDWDEMKKLSIFLQCYNVDSELGLRSIIKIKIYLKVDDIKPGCWSTRDALNPYIITNIPLPNNLNTKSKSTSHEIWCTLFWNCHFLLLEFWTIMIHTSINISNTSTQFLSLFEFK